MKQIISLILAITTLFLICGCSTVSQDTESEQETETYLIPDSYFIFTNTSAKEAADTLIGLGYEYCTTALEVDDGLQLELTEEQQNNLINRNNEYMEKIASDFLKSNAAYRYEPDETYQKLTLYFDEKISTNLHVLTVLGIASGYGMNYILTKNTTDWSVQISIINCHTGNEVISMNIPQDSGSYGEEEWENSYY